MPITSITKLYGSFHIRHLVIPILLATPSPSSSTYPHGGSLHCPQRPPTSAPSRFSLSNHVRSSSGNPTHTVHLRVLPPPYLRRKGRGGLRFYLSFLVFLRHSHFLSLRPSSAHRILHILATTYKSTISITYLAHVRY